MTIQGNSPDLLYLAFSLNDKYWIGFACLTRLGHCVRINLGIYPLEKIEMTLGKGRLVPLPQEKS